MEVKKRKVTLRRIFFRYLLSLTLTFIAFVALYFLIVDLLCQVGVVLPANHSENLAKQAKPTLETAQKISEDMIPEGCRFAVFDKNYKVVKTNLNSQDLFEATQFAKGSYQSYGGTKQYYFIERQDGSCVLQYYITMRFHSDFLNKNFPNPERMLILIFVFLCLSIIFIISTLYAKSLKKHLNPLLQVTQKIKEQDLDFQISSSGIREFDDVLISLSDMKEELKQSLEKQWNIEQARKEQISALAHDIKTPLAVIKGNSELLIDSPLNKEQQEYIGFIHKNTNQIEKYVKTLIYLSKAETDFVIKLKKVKTKEFTKDICTQLNALAATKQLNAVYEQKSLPSEIVIDQDLMYRAVMNVISNAVDYSPKNSKIYFKVETLQDKICFTITDSGKGFSNKDIKCAANQFYMGDNSRSSRTHYGMGLYITSSIVNQHKGELLIGNSSVTGGAQVEIKIPLS